MKNRLSKITTTHAAYGISIIRIVLGIVFMAHGSQKLFGMFNGPGLEGTSQFMASLGLEPSYLMAILAGTGEFLGGLLLFLGLFARLGAILTTIVSIVALFSVHIHHGFFMSNNGYEYILVLMITSFAIVIEGAGKLSIDSKINNTKN